MIDCCPSIAVKVGFAKALLVCGPIGEVQHRLRFESPTVVSDRSDAQLQPTPRNLASHHCVALLRYVEDLGRTVLQFLSPPKVAVRGFLIANLVDPDLESCV